MWGFIPLRIIVKLNSVIQMASLTMSSIQDNFVVIELEMKR